MEPLTAAMLAIAALLVVFRVAMSTGAAKKVRRRGIFSHGPGAGASGAFYEMLNEDKRAAIEVIVDENAAERDEETADDTMPPAANS